MLHDTEKDNRNVNDVMIMMRKDVHRVCFEQLNRHTHTHVT
jgi:hypothetical protein